MMKTLFITALAAASVAAAAPTAVGSLQGIDLTTASQIDVSSYRLSTADATSSGYTMMLTFSANSAATESSSGSILWLSTSASNSIGTTDYNNSTATVGVRSQNHTCQGLGLFNAANGSSTTNQVEWHEAGLSGDNGYSFGATTLFVTSECRDSKSYVTLHELTADGTLKLTNINDGLVAGAVNTLVVGNWHNNGSIMASGTVDVTFYNGVLTEGEMQSLMVPEPATATLSLLALAGLAARRRRK